MPAFIQLHKTLNLKTLPATCVGHTATSARTIHEKEQMAHCAQRGKLVLRDRLASSGAWHNYANCKKKHMLQLFYKNETPSHHKILITIQMACSLRTIPQ